MFLNRLFNNKYIFTFRSFINNTNEYGLKNAVRISSRNKKTDYAILKNDFQNNKYSNDIYNIIEKRMDKNLHINTPEDFGYCAVGPVIYDYIKWLCSNDSYNQLLFLSREGWILKKAFDIYTKNKNINKKSNYFLSSRRAASVAAIKNVDDIKEILNQYYKGNIINLLKSRFGITLNCEDFYVTMPEDINKVMELIDVEQIIDNAKSERKNYKGYIGNIDDGFAVADIGYNGTIQYFLSKMLNVKIQGLYICSHYKNRPQSINCKLSSLFPVTNMLEEQTNKIFKNQICFEAILKAPYGQLICFDKNYNPIYDIDTDYDDVVKDIQKGILSFIDEFSVIDTNIFNKTTFTAELFDVLINGMVSEDILKQLKVEDKYCTDGNLKFIHQ